MTVVFKGFGKNNIYERFASLVIDGRIISPHLLTIKYRPWISLAEGSSFMAVSENFQFR